MDITDLQWQLREFVAEWRWDPYSQELISGLGRRSSAIAGDIPMADRKGSSLSNRIRGNDGAG